MPSHEENNGNEHKKTPNNDFLEQFFKYNNLFPKTNAEPKNISRNIPENNTKRTPTEEILNLSEKKRETQNTEQLIPDFPGISKNFPAKRTKISASQKDINLKKLFQNIEAEKNEHKTRIQKKINSTQEKKKYVPTVEMIQLQSEFRALFEDFLKILPLIEKSARLQEIEERYTRKSRSDREYFPELWENEGSIIFKEIHQEENIFEQKPIALKKKEKEEQKEAEKKEAEERLLKIQEQELLEKKEEERQQEKFLQEQQKRQQEIAEAKKKHQEKILLQKRKEEKIALEKRKQEKALQEERHAQRIQKDQEIKQSVINFSQGIGEKTQNVFAAAGKKITEHSENISAQISEFSAQKTAPKESIISSSLRRKKLAQLRSIKREKKIREIKKESEILEGIKIISMVVGLFLIAMIGLNSGAMLEVTEKYWNAKEYAEKQESTEKLVQKSEQSAQETFKNIPSLPVAGPETKTKKGFDTKMYLNISPPDTRIVIPKLGKNIPILNVGDNAREKEDWNKLEKDIQKALQDGVVHYPGTANPGQFGNVFITGHSSYYPWDKGKYKDVFAALHDLEEGDEYFIFYKGKKYRYIITTRKVVSPSDVSVLEQDTSQKTSTLMTCTPVGTTARRLILQAQEAGVSY